LICDSSREWEELGKNTISLKTTKHGVTPRKNRIANILSVSLSKTIVAKRYDSRCKGHCSPFTRHQVSWFKVHILTSSLDYLLNSLSLFHVYKCMNILQLDLNWFVYSMLSHKEAPGHVKCLFKLLLFSKDAR
jgi:hypothetical protein